MDINFCCGCFGCWLKTPGLCIYEDDMVEIYRDYIASDLVVFTSDVILGYTSSGLKKASERLIPIMHPYMILEDNEFHHEKRYDKYPDTGLILTGEVPDKEGVAIIAGMYYRGAKNAKATLRFVKTSRDSVEEVFNEIDSY